MSNFVVRVVKQSDARHIYFQRFADVAVLVKSFALQVHTIRDLAGLERTEIPPDVWENITRVVNVGGSFSYPVPDAVVIVERLQ